MGTVDDPSPGPGHVVVRSLAGMSCFSSSLAIAAPNFAAVARGSPSKEPTATLMLSGTASRARGALAPAPASCRAIPLPGTLPSDFTEAIWGQSRAIR